MRILVADDEPKLGRLVAEMLETGGHAVERVRGGVEAVQAIDRAPYDLVITDLRMPEVDGLAVLRHARIPRPGVEVPDVLVVTAFGTAESAVEAMKLGASDYLTKPFSMDELRIRVAKVASKRTSEAKNADLLGRLTPNLVAVAPTTQSVVAAAKRVAETDTTVLLLGESGTGKSQLARFIHYSSKRASGPFVEVHCAALPENLLESELFGYEKGAFTGAEQKKEGLLAAAEGGTLFLEEIGEITPATQVKLLRFLQEREFVPIGSSRPRKIDVRVVAATNRDLLAAVKRGTFREDLYYRLNVFPIATPPLRARPDDIVPIAERHLAMRGVPSNKLSSAARDYLRTAPWPGNVRELENALERALILAGDRPIDPEHLRSSPAASFGGESGFATVIDQIVSRSPDDSGSFNLDRFERDLLHAAIARTGGNKTAAARLLGITRRRLYSRIKSLDEKTAEAGED